MSLDVRLGARSPRGLRRRAWIARLELATSLDPEACRKALAALSGEDLNEEGELAAQALGHGNCSRLAVTTRWGDLHLERASGRHPALRLVSEREGVGPLIQAVNALMAVIQPRTVDIRRGRGEHRRVANYFMSYEAARTVLGGSAIPARERLLRLQKRRHAELLRVSSGFVFVRASLRSS